MKHQIFQIQMTYNPREMCGENYGNILKSISLKISICQRPLHSCRMVSGQMYEKICWTYRKHATTAYVCSNCKEWQCTMVSHKAPSNRILECKKQLEILVHSIWNYKILAWKVALSSINFKQTFSDIWRSNLSPTHSYRLF